MNTAILRSRILDMAIKGELTHSNTEEWETVKLGDICKTTSGGTPQSKNPLYYRGGDIPWLQSGELHQKYITNTAKKITQAGYDNSSAKYYPINSVLIALYGATVGEVAISKIALTSNQAVCAIFPSERVYEEYLYYFLKTKKSEYIGLASGGAQPNISQEKVKNTDIPLPPLPEQRRIVAKVEELLGEVDKIEHSQTDITHAATILRSRILDSALKGELTHSNTDEWENVSLIDACKITMGQSPSGESYNPIEGIEFHQGKTFFGEKYLKPSHIYTNSPTKLADAHSIVISVRAPVGTSNIVDRQICIGRGLAAICPKSNADLMFIYYLLESRSCLLYLNDNATGTTFKAISGDILKKYSFPLPPLLEQRRIVAKVEELFAEIDKLIN